MKNTKNISLVLAGALVGASIAGPAANAATEYFQAQRTAHPIYVDGQQVQLEAYAHSFQFLCDRAGIPCIFVHSDDHQWNKVYVEGQWWDVDVTAADCGDETDLREYITVLQPPSDMQGYSYINSNPETTAFAQELLVPGSTK